jgi:peptidylprolyl isomerase
MFAPAPNLDGQYTIWGQVVAGMDAVDKIKRGAPGSGTVTNPDRLLRARLAPA